MHAPIEVLPWHHQQWQMLTRAFQHDALPHALLLHGADGLGMDLLMQRLTQSLICMNTQIVDAVMSACGSCNACRQYSEDGGHADVFRLRLEEGDREIKIDRARAAAQFTTMAAHYGGRKVIQIEPADKLSLGAANAMLKTLEEPSPQMVIIMITSRPARLLPTIRSRCQQLRFIRPDTAVAVKWLEQQGIEAPERVLAEAGGLPLKACQLVKDDQTEWRQERDRELKHYLMDKRSPTRLAQHWLQYDQTDIHAWLYDRIRRMQWFYSGIAASIENMPHLKSLAETLRLEGLDLLKPVLDALARNEKHNINKQLSMESLLISLSASATSNRSKE